MAKLAFSKLGLKVNNQVININHNAINNPTWIVYLKKFFVFEFMIDNYKLKSHLINLAIKVSKKISIATAISIRFLI